MLKVSVVILNWNGKKFLHACLTSLQRVTYKPLEVVLVDNNSSDESVSFVRKNFPWVRLVALQENTGFAKGNNIGFKKSTGKYVLFLNNDTVVSPNFLESMVTAMEDDPSIGCIQPQMRIMDKPKIQDEAGGYLTHFGFLYHYGYKKRYSLAQYINKREVFSIKGACMLVPRHLFSKIGLFDEDFFIFFEETDVCHRIWLSGYRVVYDPKTHIHHVVGGDTSNKYSYKRRLYLTFRNMTCSYLKNFGTRNILTVFPLFLVLQAGLVCSYIVKFQWYFIPPIVSAYIWNIQNIKKTLKKRAFIQTTLRTITDAELNAHVLYDPGLNYYSHTFRDALDHYTDVALPPCPICGSTNSSQLYESYDRMFGLPGDFRVLRCRVCFQVFLDPFLSASQSKKYYPSQSYYAYQSQKKKGWLGNVREYLILHYYRPTILSRMISLFIHSVPAIPSNVRHGKVLDMGCGTGDTLMFLRTLGWDVYGMEMDKKAVEIAKKRGLDNISLGTFEELQQYKDHSFDAIRLYHVIEHLPDPQLCLDLLYRKLKKGGELIIGTPNRSSLVARMFGSYWYNLDSPRHLFLFNPKTLKNLAVRAGFTVKRQEFCSAGGLVGSIQYLVNDVAHTNIDLIHRLGFILFFYPIEWILDKIQTGDVFVMRMTR